MTKNFYFLLLLILGISCSNPTEKQKTAEENFQKKEITRLDQLEFSGSPQMIIKTAEEYKQYAKKINYNYGIFKCNMSLIFAYNATGKYKEAALIGKENDALINKIKADYFVCLNYTNVASAYSYLGLLDEAENCLNKALVYNGKLKNGNDKYYSLGVIYSGFAFVEGMKGESSPNLDKVQKSYLKQLWALLQVDENNKKMTQKKNAQLSMLYLNLGITSSELKNPQEAENYFHKALDICRKYKFTNNNTPLFANTEIARLFLDQKKYDSCIIHAQKGIILEKKSHSPEIRRDLFQILYQSSLAKGDRKTSEKYTNLYIKLNDSMMNAEKRGINTPVKVIMENKEKEKNSTVKNVIIISAVISVILLLCGWLFWKRKNKKLKKDYEKLIEKSKYVNQNAGISIKNTSNNDAINILLDKLNNFEKLKQFLNTDITLNSLASHLEIAPDQLSEIVRQYKFKTFSNYINDLRINHIVFLLYSDSKLRIHKENYFVDISGFHSKSEFMYAFKKATGIPFSYFLKKIQKN
jgi:tetratricopeptide (TPR) repeat protein